MVETELIRKVTEGNEEAFSLLVKLHGQNIFQVCIGYVHHKEDAEDLAQEIFIEVYKSIKYFKGNSKLSTWLYRIAVNKSLNFLKKQKKEAIFERIELLLGIGKELKELQHPQQLIENQETSVLLKQAIDSLPKNQRTAFILSKYKDLPYIEISEIMNTSVSAVESLLHRAKSNLQQKLVAHYKK